MRAVLALACLLAALAAPAGAQGGVAADVWFARAGAIGDGTSAGSPLGSAAEIERLTGPGDIVVLLPSDVPLGGGLALQPGQALIGLPEGGRRPVVTNADTTRHGGVGIVLADGVRVWNVRVEDTVASGILGRDVSAQIDGVEVVGANRGRLLLDTGRPLDPLYAPPHGGIVVVHSAGTVEVVVTASTVLDAAGVGILSVTMGTARSRLAVRHTRVEGGAGMGFYDTAVAALVRDSTAHVRLDLSDVEAGGRLSRAGRNVMVEAAGGARADAWIERSHLGPTGQDGVLATSLQSPAVVELYVRDSVVEGAGQMNVEGTILNFPPDGAQSANAGRVSIEIERSVVRSATTTLGFEDEGTNVWLGPSGGVDDLPQAAGTYELTVRDSRIEDAERVGLQLGLPPDSTGARTDEGVYDVTLRGTAVVANGATDVAIYAADARVDARGNCWGRPEGPDPSRIRTRVPAVASQVDASNPIHCTGDADLAPPWHDALDPDNR